ncbi:MAG: ferritin [Candidatus Azobacteroides sp.]|nr:ferritin [Candidatus Azobacteroides sp.]
MELKTTLDKSLETAFNDQANAELWSAYLYLSMSYDMKDKGYDGIGEWFAKQAQEEFEHATKFFDYVQARDGKVKLSPIQEVRQEWASPKEAFLTTLAHEQVVTKRIYELMEKAEELKDYPSRNFLNWFIDEQVEEEDTPRKYLSELEKIGENPAALYLFDQKLGQRQD